MERRILLWINIVDVAAIDFSGFIKTPSGSRTRTSAMARRQAAATSWARYGVPNCQRSQSTGRDSNSRRRITGAVSSPLDDQCHQSLQWDQTDLNPHLPGLRARYAAANTLIPCSACFTRRSGRGGNRTLDLVLIRDLLSPLSYAPSVGPKGLEPLLAGLKVRCAAVTPRPRNVGRAYPFQSCLVHALAPCFQW